MRKPCDNLGDTKRAWRMAMEKQIEGPIIVSPPHLSVLVRIDQVH